jgi:hypothetical protein
MPQGLERVARLWRRLRCRRDHGDVLALDDELWVYCWKCGAQSVGLQIDTADVLRAWAFDRMRLRFRSQRRKAS